MPRDLIFRWMQPFEQIDELAELRNQTVLDGRRIAELERDVTVLREQVDAYEAGGAEDAELITKMSGLLAALRTVGYWCPNPTATGGALVRVDDLHNCTRAAGHKLLYVLTAR